MQVTVLLAVLGGLLRNEVVNADPLGRLGCHYYEHALIFNCDGSSLDRVLEAVRYLEQKFSHTNRIPVRHVNLLHGDFTELPFFLSKFNDTLEGIRIHNTNLTHIYPDAFLSLSRVRFLDLSKNNLTAIPYAVSALHNLQFLNVSSNRLRTLEPRSQFSSWRRLRLLDLSTNYIDKLEFLDLSPSSSTIERILLDNNDIQSVPQEWNSLLMPQLKEISLNNNALKTIPVFHARYVPRLTTVRLRKNNIETFPFYFMPTSPAGNLTVDMSGNPLRCDCQSTWLREWRLQIPNDSLHLSLPNCAHPVSLRGAHLENINPVGLACPSSHFAPRYRARGFPNHTILALTTLEHSISVTWKVDDKHLPWTIVYRHEAESPYAIKLHNRSGEGPHSSADDAIFTDIVQGLESESRYVICAALSIVEDNNQHFEMDPAACQSVSTKGPRQSHKNTTEHTRQVSSLFMAPVVEKRRVSQRVTTQLLAMRGGQRSIWVRWKLKVTQLAVGNTTLYRTRRNGGDDESTASREWIVLTRKIGTGNFSEVRVSDTSGHSKNGNVYNYTVSSLAPDTAYDCCLVPIDTLVEDTMADRTVPGGLRDIPVHLQLSVEQTLMMCKEIVTLADNVKRLTSASAAGLDGRALIVVVAASAFVTVVVVAALCFCCCPASRNILRCFSDGISQAPCKSASTDKAFSVTSAEQFEGKDISGGTSGANRNNNRLRMNNSFNSTKNLVNFMDDEPSQLNNTSNFISNSNGGNTNSAPQRHVNSAALVTGSGAIVPSIDNTVRRIPMKPPNIPLPPIPTEVTPSFIDVGGMSYKMCLPPVPPSLSSKCKSETFDNKIATLDAGRLTLMYSEWEDMPVHSQATQRPRRSRSEVRAPAARPFASLGNVYAASHEDPLRQMRSLGGNRPQMIDSDGGSYNDTSSDDDKKILNAQPRKIQRHKTTINWANGMPFTEDVDGSGAVAYLDGRKVQVFGLGVSKTLPKSILRKGARPLAPHIQTPGPTSGPRVAGRSAARTQSHHSRSFKKLARSPPIVRRSSQAQNHRLHFCTFGKVTNAPCTVRATCSACAAESQSVTSNSDNCSSMKHLCAHSSTTSSDCDVFIEHV